MRADNEGEGGILALFALAKRRLISGKARGPGRWWRWRLAGTAFFLL